MCVFMIDGAEGSHTLWQLLSVFIENNAKLLVLAPVIWQNHLRHASSSQLVAHCSLRLDLSRRHRARGHAPGSISA
jgi:hypothetical protein